MRLFQKQDNLIETTPAIDKVTGLPQTDLVLAFALYDGDTLVPDSNITLTHVGNGIYRGTLPELDSLETKKYDVELSSTRSGHRLFYFKGPAKAIIRSQFDV